MKGIDPATAEFYSAHAADLAERYAACEGLRGVAKYFTTAFAEGSRVLDVGAGTGRDLHTLLELGYDAWGIEPCEALIETAEQTYPAVQGRISHGGLPALGSIDDHSFDGVLCSAVLMHLPECCLEDSAAALHRVLGADGRLLVSLPVGDVTGSGPHRTSDGRLFNGIDEAGCRSIFEKTGLQPTARWEDRDSLGRKDRGWLTVLFTP